jgi:DHA1 family tetracycline resistance protein-like MFS transporter
LTNIIAPLLFTAGLFRYFTSPTAAFSLPGAPFLVGSALLITAQVIVRRVFFRLPEQPRPDIRVDASTASTE